MTTIYYTPDHAVPIENQINLLNQFLNNVAYHTAVLALQTNAWNVYTQHAMWLYLQNTANTTTQTDYMQSQAITNQITADTIKAQQQYSQIQEELQGIGYLPSMVTDKDITFSHTKVFDLIENYSFDVAEHPSPPPIPYVQPVKGR